MALPTVSVVMAVYNGQDYLRASVDSILGQTLIDFEFVIVDDGSSDRTDEILETFSDPRIRIIRNARNLGLPASLNRGLMASRGKYVARQDADDLSLPERLELQANYLDAHPRVGLLGTGRIVIDRDGEQLTVFSGTCSDVEMRWGLLFFDTLAHPSVMFRRDIVEKLGGYHENSFPAEDYELWSRMSEVTGITALDTPLIKYRYHKDSVSFSHSLQQQAMTEWIVQRNLCKAAAEPELQGQLWDAVQKFWRLPAGEDRTLSRTVVKDLRRFFYALDAGFHSCLDASGKEIANNRCRVYRLAGKRALALALRHHSPWAFGKRKLDCRAKLATWGIELLFCSVWLPPIPYRPSPASPDLDNHPQAVSR